MINSPTKPPNSPTFLVLGAAKAGTTSICRELASHPDVLLSNPKEPVFFELEYAHGPEFYWQKYYQEWSGHTAAGEGRVYNLYLPYVPDRIAGAFPDAKLIVALRNPVDRAYSHWWHRVTRGYERRPFEEAATQELADLAAGRRFDAKLSESSWRNNFYRNTASIHTADLKEVRYLEMGSYAEQLQRYVTRFPRSNIRVIIFEEMILDMLPVLRDLWDLLGVDPTSSTSAPVAHNVAEGHIKNRFTFAVERFSWAIGLTHIVPKHVRNRIRGYLPSKSAVRPPLAAGIKADLTAHFATDRSELEALLGRSLSIWQVAEADDE